MTAERPGIVSVDDHLVEPPSLWQERLPKRYRSIAPQVIEIEDGEAWVFGTKVKPVAEQGCRFFEPGSGKADLVDTPVRYSEMRRGAYDVDERVKDMDRAGVDVSACFPSFPRFCGQEFYEHPDRELNLACIQAYNDWLLEDWCGSHPGRFIGLIIIPLWEPELAVAEIYRCAARGARGVTFPENPHPLGLPSVHDKSMYWDPVHRAAEETGLPLCTHIGSSSTVPRPSPESPHLVTGTLIGLNAAYTLADWLFSGIFLRFPDLKLCLSEGGIGWIPNILERAEWMRRNRGEWAKRGTDIGYSGFTGGAGHWDARVVDTSFVDVFRSNVFGCFIEDEHGIKNIEAIGIDNVMVECDFPHADSSWPDTADMVYAQIRHLPQDVQRKIVRGNAERVFKLVG